MHLKLERAEDHLRELEELLEPVKKLLHEDVRRQEGPDPGVIRYVAGALPVIPERASVIIGDALFNMRSALEHLACALVRLDGDEPSESTSFPIFAKRPTGPLSLDRRGGRPIANRAIALAVDWVQPYRQEEYGSEPADASISLVNVLTNADKHRLILPVVSAICGHKPGWWASGADDKCPRWRYNLEPLNSGDTIVEFLFEDGTIPVDFDPHPALVVSLGEVDKAPGVRLRDVSEVLSGPLEWLRWELKWIFGPLFERGPAVENLFFYDGR